MKNTRQNIIEAAIQLYNEQGLANVRNQDIAEASGMSLSNFNYHFKNKSDLVLVLFDQMMKDLDEKVYDNNRRFIQGDGTGLLKSYLEFQCDYKFFYLDSYNVTNSYPEVKKRFLKRIDDASKIVKNMFYMGVGKGYLHPVPQHRPNLFDELFDLLYFKNHFLLQYMTMTDAKEDFVSKGLSCSFFILDPYLTDKGRKVLNGYFDKERKKVHLKED